MADADGNQRPLDIRASVCGLIRKLGGPNPENKNFIIGDSAKLVMLAKAFLREQLLCHRPLNGF